MGAIAKKDLRSYGMLALPLAVAGLPLYMHAPDFYVTEKGVSLGLLGLVLLLVRIVDAVQDPLFGSLSDRFSDQRKLIIMGGVMCMGLGIAALFTPPLKAGIFWFGFWVIFSTSAYSLVSINLNALGGLWSTDPFERTRIASVRERFGLIGVSCGVIIPAILIAYLSKVSAFGWFSMVLCGLLGFSVWRFFRWAESHPELFRPSEASSSRGPLYAFPTDTRIRRLLVVTLVGSLASALPAVLFLLFVRDQLLAESWTGAFLVIYFIAALAGVPVWRDISKRSGKVRTWCYTMGLAVVSFVGALFVGEGDLIVFGLVCLATGFALGGDLVFPGSLMADFIGDNEVSRLQASSGYAWLSLVQKAALGLGAGIAFPLLDRWGFVSGASNSGGALLGLVLLYAGLPLILKLVAAALAWRWKNLLEGVNTYEKTTNRDGDRNDRDDLNTKRMQYTYEN